MKLSLHTRLPLRTSLTPRVLLFVLLAAIGWRLPELGTAALAAVHSARAVFDGTVAEPVSVTANRAATLPAAMFQATPKVVATPTPTPFIPVATMSLADPLACTGPNGTAAGTVQVQNPTGVNQPFTLNTTFTNFTGVLGSCVLTGAAPGAVCNVTANGLTANGNILANTTLTVQYQANVVNGTTATVMSTGTVGTVPVTATATATISCPGVNTGALVSDQSPGSVLIYNIYTSSGTGQANQNTRLNITNTSTSAGIYVHLFFVDGSTCAVADSYLCLTANQTSSFLASDLDPGTTGYLVAVAVNSDGCPVSFNSLIGDVYVKFASGHAANFGAEALPALWGFFFDAAGRATDRSGNLCQINGAANPAANAADCGNNANPLQFFAGGLPVLPGCTANSDTALLNFNGVTPPGASPGYTKLPRTLAVDNLPSRLDGNDTLLIVNRLGGSLLTGAATVGTIFGIMYDDAENALSYSITAGTCQLRGSFSNSFPRTAPRFEQFIPAGRSGWTRFYSGIGAQTDNALLGAAINYNGSGGSTAFNQGHNLHKLTLTAGNTPITIPVFPPSC